MPRSSSDTATQARVEHAAVLVRQAARAARAKAEQHLVDTERRLTEAALTLEKALHNLFRRG